MKTDSKLNRNKLLVERAALMKCNLKKAEVALSTPEGQVA